VFGGSFVAAFAQSLMSIVYLEKGSKFLGFRLQRMHEMQTSVCGGHSVQPLPNYFGLLLVF